MDQHADQILANLPAGKLGVCLPNPEMKEKNQTTFSFVIKKSKSGSYKHVGRVANKIQQYDRN